MHWSSFLVVCLRYEHLRVFQGTPGNEKRSLQSLQVIVLKCSPLSIKDYVSKLRTGVQWATNSNY